MDINNPTPEGEQPPATAATASTTGKKRRTRRKLRRTMAGALALVLGLTGAGLVAQAFTPDQQTATAEMDAEQMITQGQEIYEVACITCHGANLQGVQDRGPSLVGVGEGSVYFQVHSGRMPMKRNEAQADVRTRASRGSDLALAAYVNANGGGPGIVKDAREHRHGVLRGPATRRRDRPPRRRPRFRLFVSTVVLPQLHR